MGNRPVFRLEEIAVQIYLDAAELDARLPELVKTGSLKEEDAKKIAYWARNLHHDAVNRVSPCFSADLAEADIKPRIEDFGVAITQLINVLEEHLDVMAIRYYANRMGSHVRDITPEFEKRSIAHGFGDKPARGPVKGGWELV